MSDTNDINTETAQEWQDITVQAVIILQDKPELSEKKNDYFFTAKGKRTLSDCGTYLMKAHYVTVREETETECQDMYDLVKEAIEKNGSFGIEKSIKIDTPKVSETL